MRRYVDSVIDERIGMFFTMKYIDTRLNERFNQLFEMNARVADLEAKISNPPAHSAAPPDSESSSSCVPTPSPIDLKKRRAEQREEAGLDLLVLGGEKDVQSDASTLSPRRAAKSRRLEIVPAASTANTTPARPSSTLVTPLTPPSITTPVTPAAPSALTRTPTTTTPISPRTKRSEFSGLTAAQLAAKAEEIQRRQFMLMNSAKVKVPNKRGRPKRGAVKDLCTPPKATPDDFYKLTFESTATQPPPPQFQESQED